MSGAEPDKVFAGSIPKFYDQYLVPLIFEPYADDLARRLASRPCSRVLEIAAGTGVVTRRLATLLPAQASIVATDLNRPMLDMAAEIGTSRPVEWREADAMQLPFDEGLFDAVVCQFGVMFFPDKVKGNAEARRVLRDGGSYVLVIWNSVDANLATKHAGAAVADLFPDDTAAFYERIPFRYHDEATIEADLLAAGFREIAIETVELISRAASARDAAIALTQGTPMRSEIERRGPDALAMATDAAERALRQFEGSDGFAAPMSAHIVTARK